MTFGRRADALILAPVFVGALQAAPAAFGQSAGATPGSFRVTESGGAEYRIPIRVPPGVAGVEPKLALLYSSQAGNGLLGMGWNLEGLSAIARCPRTMPQDGARGGVNYDQNDRYCLDGQRLVLVPESPAPYGADGAEYRTERESFSKVISHGAAGNGPASFTVQTKSGQIVEYGHTEDSRIQAQGKPTVRVWAVSKVSDTKGNFYSVSYIEDVGNGEFYPERIQYSGSAATGAAPGASVKFVYQERTDKSPMYVAGSLIKTVSRLATVVTSVGAATVDEYRLTYDNGGASGRSKLTAVQQCAAGGCLPQTRFDWDNGASGDIQHWSNSSEARGAVNNHEHYFADVNGDGRADWLQVARHVDAGWVGLANPDGSFAHWTSSTTAAGAVNNYAHYFVDVNGDGKADWIQVARYGDFGWVGLSNGNGTFTHWTSASTARGSVSNYEHYFADVDGDGRTDWIQVARYGDFGWVGLSNGDGSFTHWTSSTTAAGSANNYAHYFADVNGDGKADWIQVARYGDFGWVGLSNGDGSFTHWTSASTARGSASNYEHYFADVNGDGRADWIQVARYGDFGWVGLSNGDGTFAHWTSSTTSAGAVNNYTHDFADVNGDGRADWIQVARYGDFGWIGLSNGDGTFTHWTSASTVRGSASNYEHYFADVNGDGLADWIQVARGANAGWVGLATGTPPDLMALATAGLGASVQFTYKPLTDAAVYSKDSTASYPWMDLQHPMYVVSAMTSSDGRGGSQTATFAYGGAKLDHGGRGLLGFRWRESASPATGLKVRTEQRQDWPYLGLPSLVRKTQSSGTLLSEVTNTFQCTEPGTTAACTVAPGKRYFPHMSESLEIANDLNGASLPATRTTSQYDLFGNANSVVVSTSDGHSKSTTNTFANDPVRWILGRLTQSTVTSTIGAGWASPPPPQGGAGGGTASPAPPPSPISTAALMAILDLILD